MQTMLRVLFSPDLDRTSVTWDALSGRLFSPAKTWPLPLATRWRSQHHGESEVAPTSGSDGFAAMTTLSQTQRAKTPAQMILLRVSWRHGAVPTEDDRESTRGKVSGETLLPSGVLRYVFSRCFHCLLAFCRYDATVKRACKQTLLRLLRCYYHHGKRQQSIRVSVPEQTGIRR